MIGVVRGLSKGEESKLLHGLNGVQKGRLNDRDMYRREWNVFGTYLSVPKGQGSWLQVPTVNGSWS